MYSHLQHCKTANGELRALADLRARNMAPQVHTGQEAGWTSEPVSALRT